MWLAETSQQPISQTTWLKVTPHCNHCNHYSFRNLTCGVIPWKASVFGFWWSVWALSPASLHTERHTKFQAYPCVIMPA
jgi:hypothetical protein